MEIPPNQAAAALKGPLADLGTRIAGLAEQVAKLAAATTLLAERLDRTAPAAPSGPTDPPPPPADHKAQALWLLERQGRLNDFERSLAESVARRRGAATEKQVAALAETLARVRKLEQLP